MTRWLLNSAVIPAGGYGTYTYDSLDAAELGAWLRAGPYTSRVGYPETATYIAAITGEPAPAISRELSTLHPGDEAAVVRLRYRIANPKTKGGPLPGGDPAAWEVGLLRRLR